MPVRLRSKPKFSFKSSIFSSIFFCSSFTVSSSAFSSSTFDRVRFNNLFSLSPLFPLLPTVQAAVHLKSSHLLSILRITKFHHHRHRFIPNVLNPLIPYSSQSQSNSNSHSFIRFFSTSDSTSISSFPSLSTPSDVDSLIFRMFGSGGEFLFSPKSTQNGRSITVHCTSTYQPPLGGSHSSSSFSSSPLYSLRVGSPSSPRSLFDSFCLNLCRVRADHLLLTGEILRKEPHLTADVQSPFKSILNQWWQKQNQSNGHRETERTNGSALILTRQKPNLNELNHPMYLESERTVKIYSSYNVEQKRDSGDRTDEKNAFWTEQLRFERKNEHGNEMKKNQSVSVEVIRPISPHSANAIEAIRYLQRQHRQLSTVQSTSPLSVDGAWISVEAGPSTTNFIYSQAAAHHLSVIDYIVLSVYRGPLLSGGISTVCVIPTAVSSSSTFQLTFDFLHSLYDCLHEYTTGDWSFYLFQSKKKISSKEILNN